MIQTASIRKSFDTAIIGGGILGLWAARHAIKRGEQTILIEKRHIGAGASGGFLGALMPHMPDNWNAKKQFQFDGLTSLPDAIAELEADTGHDCGYRRCGRIMPLTHDKLLPQVERRLAGAKTNWGDDFSMTLEAPAAYQNWLNSDIASNGIQHDTLAARVNPRAYVRALEAYMRPRCEVLEGGEVRGVNFQQHDGEVMLANGDSITAGKIIIANGWEAYPLLQPFFAELNDNAPIGRGVKGQAVLVEYEHADDLPIVYHDGSYVVPHKENRVAIGSTSVNDWSGKPDVFDPEDMDFYRRAIELVPALENAPIIERWSGVRPRNTLKGRGTSPWFGPIPAYENHVALIGGFKITLGVAHLAERFV
ncbi:MAG: FAD-dependent oxidoreductase [Rhizobiaceae bacterium]|nr:FAD-dependent oxidoreductase [Rhizobiaceae bacterium]